MVKILQTMESVAFDDLSRPYKTLRVKWAIDDRHGPYTDTFRMDELNGLDIRQKLETRAQQILLLKGNA